MAIDMVERLNAETLKIKCNTTKLCGFEQCAKCGGMCCKENACAYVPGDVPGGVSKENIVAMLDQHVAMIFGTMVRVAPKSYIPNLYLSAPEKQNTNGVRVSVLHSPCALLTEKGCTLSSDKRPLQGLALIPSADGKSCESLIDFTNDILKDWEQYQDLLGEIVKERTGKTAQELLNEVLFDKAYTPISGGEALSLPMYLKQKLQYSCLYSGQPITDWQYTALTMLLTHRFFADYRGLELENALKSMMDCVTVTGV